MKDKDSLLSMVRSTSDSAWTGPSLVSRVSDRDSAEMTPVQTMTEKPPQ